jgi:hypothetical protein
MHTLYAYFTRILSVGFLMSKEKRRNYRFPYLSLLCHHFQHKWLTNRSNRSEKRTRQDSLGHLCFLEHHCFLSEFEAIFASKGEHSLLGLSACPLRYRHNTFTLYMYGVLNTHAS